MYYEDCTIRVCTVATQFLAVSNLNQTDNVKSTFFYFLDNKYTMTKRKLVFYSFVQWAVDEWTVEQ